MITVDEARKLCGVNLEEDYITYIDSCIRKAAEAGETSVVIREDPYAKWLYNAAYATEVSGKVLKRVRDAGFKTTFYYVEKQFTDFGLHIHWN